MKNHSTIPCQYGIECKHLIRGECRYYHPPNHHRHHFGKVLCKFGNQCNFFKNGHCIYAHPFQRIQTYDFYLTNYSSKKRTQYILSTDPPNQCQNSRYTMKNFPENINNYWVEPKRLTQRQIKQKLQQQRQQRQRQYQESQLEQERQRREIQDQRERKKIRARQEIQRAIQEQRERERQEMRQRIRRQNEIRGQRSRLLLAYYLQKQQDKKLASRQFQWYFSNTKSFLSSQIPLSKLNEFGQCAICNFSLELNPEQANTSQELPKQSQNELLIESNNHIQNLLMELYCKHIFHKECIRKWLIINTQCPICRKKFHQHDEYKKIKEEKQKKQKNIKEILSLKADSKTKRKYSL